MLQLKTQKSKVVFSQMYRKILYQITLLGRCRGTPHDVLATYRYLIKRPFLFLNAGLGLTDADELLRAGEVDAIAFGRLWISHPDLQLRIERGIPADTPIDFRTVNGHPDVDPRKGYTDYPFAVPVL